jgi:hypothetical protein
MKQGKAKVWAREQRLAICLVTTILAMTFAVQALPAAADDISGMTMYCREEYRKLRRQLPHRAFAASKIVDGLQACGSGWAWKTPEQAISRAIRLCKRNDYFRNLKLGDTCRIVKVF